MTLQSARARSGPEGLSAAELLKRDPSSPTWWLGIIVNLLSIGGYGDIALRDFALLLAALTFARLATAFPGHPIHLR